MKKREMTKSQKILIIVLLALSAVMMGLMMRNNASNSSSTELAEGFDEEEVLAKAKEAIALFNNREYQKIIDMSEGGMDNFITAEEIAEQCDPLLDKRGELVEYKKEQVLGTTDDEGKAYAGAYITAKYNKGKIKFILGFDEEMKLIQFQLQ